MNDIDTLWHPSLGLLEANEAWVHELNRLIPAIETYCHGLRGLAPSLTSSASRAVVRDLLEMAGVCRRLTVALVGIHHLADSPSSDPLEIGSMLDRWTDAHAHLVGKTHLALTSASMIEHVACSSPEDTLRAALVGSGYDFFDVVLGAWSMISEEVRLRCERPTEAPR